MRALSGEGPLWALENELPFAGQKIRGGGRRVEQRFPNQVHRTPVPGGVLWFPPFLTYRTLIPSRSECAP